MNESSNKGSHEFLLEQFARISQPHGHGSFDENEPTYHCRQQIHLRNLPKELLEGPREIYSTYELRP